MFGPETEWTLSGYSLHMRENGFLWFQMVDINNGPQNSETNKTYNDGQWHHFCATWSSDSYGKIYVENNV